LLAIETEPKDASGDGVTQGQEWLAKIEQNQDGRDCAECPEMVSIPSLGISIGKYEVTQGQWKAIMGSNPSYFSQYGYMNNVFSFIGKLIEIMGNNPSHFTECDDCPVEQVSWDDVQEFIVKLNQRTGKQYRLPSKKEWEAACHAGGQHKYCGSDTVDDVAWYNKNSGDNTHPVGKKKPNAFGLYDMSGNVWEWVQDCPSSYCRIQGGSWRSNACEVRGSADGIYGSGYNERDDNVGFRFALGQTAK
jgi:formylglycine-generating enzyme required for sulfatase activity